MQYVGVESSFTDFIRKVADLIEWMESELPQYKINNFCHNWTKYMKLTDKFSSYF